MNTLRLGSACLLGALLAGCPGNGGSVALEDIPTRLAPTYCNLFERCQNPFAAQFLFAGGTCEAAIEPLLADTVVAQAQASVAAGTVVYRPELVDSCLAAIDAAGCDVNALSANDCTDVFEGTVPAGGDCTWDEECQDDYCSTEGATCPGTCANRGAAGATCTEDRGCQAGLSCANGLCAAPSPEGGACEGAAMLDCAGIDLTCVGSEGMTAGTCRRWSTILSGAVGSSCSIPDDLCDDGLSCVFARIEGTTPVFECQAAVAAGAECGLGVPDQCPDDQYCMMGGGTPGRGTCTSLPDAGEPCTSSGQCAPGLRCSGGSTPTCVTPARLGAACTTDNQCVSNSCQAGACAAPEC